MASIKISIKGPIAARWSIDAGLTWNVSETQLAVVAGEYDIVFNAVTGYNPPVPLFGIVIAESDAYVRDAYYTEIETTGIYGHDNLNEFCFQKGIPSPAFDSNISFDTRTLTAQFGDGYSQRAIDGIHAEAMKCSVSWSELKLDMIKELKKYFSSRKGVNSFSWIPPRYEHEPAKRFVATTWDRGYVGFTHDSFAVRFKQVFDIT